MLPVSRELLLRELAVAGEFLAKWHQRVEEGVPGLDLPAAGNSTESAEDFLVELCGELRLIAAKCETLSEILATTQLG